MLHAFRSTQMIQQQKAYIERGTLHQSVARVKKLNLFPSSSISDVDKATCDANTQETSTMSFDDITELNSILPFSVR